MTSGDLFVTPITPIVLLDLAVLTFLIGIAFFMLKSRRLFEVVMLSGLYSLLSATFFVLLDAVDVAFTEAAVGAGISTVLMLGGMLLTARREKPLIPGRSPWALLAVVATGSALVYASLDMPAFGDPHSPANSYIGQVYIERTPQEIAMPNVVTATLASYRGYDTLGETTVIFTAGIGVMLMLGAGAMFGGRLRRDPRESGDGGAPDAAVSDAAAPDAEREAR